jgi:hypothetical protein
LAARKWAVPFSQENIMAVRLGTTQNFLASSATSVPSAVFSAGITQIRVIASAACNVRIGDATPTAVTTDTLLAANVPEYFTVAPGQKIAAIGAATLNVTECQQSK